MGFFRNVMLNMLSDDLLRSKSREVQSKIKDMEWNNTYDCNEFDELIEYNNDIVRTLSKRSDGYHIKPRENGWYLPNDED